MAKRIVIILILMAASLPSWAQPVAANDIAELQKQMYQLYNKNDQAAFMDVTNRLKEAAQKAGDERTFYKAWANQALYFANRQQRNRGQLTAKDMQQHALNHDHKFGIYTGTHVMGTIQAMMGDYEEGTQNFKKAISYLHQNFPNESAAASWIEMARISLTMKRCQEAIRNAEHIASGTLPTTSGSSTMPTPSARKPSRLTDAMTQAVPLSRCGAKSTTTSTKRHWR